MPAHKTRGQAVRFRLSNGEVLTETHRDANDRADGLAKEAVERFNQRGSHSLVHYVIKDNQVGMDALIRTW